MHDLALVMPMAGRGSRFRRQGYTVPKPLVPLAGRPFFAWAIDSVLQAVAVRELVCVVLDEHIRDHAIDAAILAHYPSARIVAVPEVTGGAAETAALGCAAVRSAGAVAINDCDHGFAAGTLQPVLAALAGGAAAALCGFPASSPNFSYVRFDPEGAVAGTVEKQAVSDWAIAGCYLFRDAETFASAYEDYRVACPYDELFVSGMYDILLGRAQRVLFHPLKRHVPFGTPEELAAVSADDLVAIDRQVAEAAAW